MSNDDSHRQRQFQVDIASLHLQESQVMLILGGEYNYVVMGGLLRLNIK